MYFRLIKLNFPFIKGEGKRRKLSFPSTVDNFRYTFRSPQYSFIASYDAKNELKKEQELRAKRQKLECLETKVIYDCVIDKLRVRRNYRCYSNSFFSRTVKD